MKYFTYIIILTGLNSCYKAPDYVAHEPPCDCRNECWSTVGATGAIDESALGTIHLGAIPKPPEEIGDGASLENDLTSYEGMSAFIQPSAKPGLYTVRFQVSPLGGFISKLKNAHFKMDIGYKMPDTSLYSLKVFLKEYKFDTLILNQSARTIASFTATPTTGDIYRSQTVATFYNLPIFLKYGYSYYVEAVFERKPKAAPPTPHTPNKISGPSIAVISICEDINP